VLNDLNTTVYKPATTPVAAKNPASTAPMAPGSD
jgi:hypothetical protein